MAAPAFAQAPRWTVDVTPASYVEAWEFNDSVEHLTGLQAGVDRRVWRTIAIRVEGMLLHVNQAGGDTWLRGASFGVRARKRASVMHLFLDVGGGWAGAGRSVPPNGTRYNYLAIMGGGIELPSSRVRATLSVRWLHLSNGGREGRRANPDIQSLGGFAGLSYAF
jgi:hypothetical protein